MSERKKREISNAKNHDSGKTAPKILRQGDVLLKSISKLPKNSKLIHDSVLARGEATGHSHRIIGGDVYKVSSSDQLLVVVGDEQQASLVHEEHNHLQVPSGIYRVIHQREYDPYEELEYHYLLD